MAVIRYTLALLGPFDIRSVASTATQTTLNRKTRAILAYLAASGKLQTRRALAELFCQSAKDPAGSLRWHLSRIRRDLDEEILDVSPQGVAFNFAIARTDLTTFQQTLTNPQQQPADTLATAVALYRGPFLDELALRDAAEFDLWLLGERARCQQLYEKGGAVLVNRFIQQERYAQAIDLAQTLLQTNALLEVVHTRLVWLYAHTGQRESALQQFEQCRDLLQEELAVDPSAELMALGTAVHQNQPLPPPVAEPTSASKLVIESTAKNDFVGRVAELQQLQKAWQGIRQQRGATILIEGVAGAGKTRLVQEFLPMASPAYYAFRGNCYESTRAIPYQPWLAILEEWRQAVSAAEMEQLAQPWQVQLSRLLPHVFPAANSAPEKQEHLFRAVAELLALGSAPRIFLLEDLQWADETSLQLFLFMAQFIKASQLPMLLLGTLRSEEVADNPALQTLLHDAQREALIQRLALPPLGKEEVSSLIGVLWLNVPEKAPLAEIRDSLLAAAGGNPLFVTEILRELTQTAVLPTPLPIPPSLQELTSRRLRQLPGSSRQVIETLAVLERPTNFDLLWQVSGRSEDESITAIELGLRWRFLEARQTNQYGFSHDLIGAAVRTQLSKIRRQRLHHRVAEALARRGADAAILAHHWGMAGDQAQQARFALQAGEYALSRAAFGDAVNLFRQALDALPTAEHQPRFQAMLGLVQAFEATSNVPELAEKLETLANLAKKTGELACRAEWAQHQAKYLLMQGELDEVETVVRQGLAWAATAQATSLQASLLETLGKTYRDQGDYDQAYAQAKHALELYQTDNNSQGQIAVLNLLGNLNVHRGQHRQAVKVHQQALALCRQITDPFSESRILAWLADALWYLGDYEEVQQVVESGLAISREIGDRVGEMVQVNNLAGLAIVEQDIERAIVYYRQALAIAESMNDPRRTAIYYSNIGGAYVSLGDIAAALSCLDKAIAIAQKAKLPRQEAHVYYTKGRAYQEEENLLAARAAFEHSLSLRQELGEQFRTFLTLIQLVEICVQLTDWPAAETHLAAAQHLYDALHDEFARYSHQMFHYVAFLFYKEQADPTAAAMHLERAHLALQDCLLELDSPAREQLRATPQAQAILAAKANLDK